MNEDLAEIILQNASSRLDNMGNGNDFSLPQQDAIMNAVKSVMKGKVLVQEESSDPCQPSPLVFKVDDVPIRVGNDMRVEATFPDGSLLVVVLTHEGIIMDFLPLGADEPAATSSMMYDEQAEEMTG